MSFDRLSGKFKNLDGPLFREVLTECLENREAVVPELLQVLEKGLKDPQKLIDRQDYILNISAMYLLAQFREKRAYPLIIDFFSKPDARALEIVGDMFIEDLGRILASVSCGDTTLLQQLIENPMAHELLRSAALEALMVLVSVGEQTRDGVIGYFSALFHGKLERRKSMVWVSLVSSAVALYPEELAVDIERAFDDRLVDESLVHVWDADDALMQQKGEVLQAFFQNSQYSLIEDVVMELLDPAEL